MGGQLPFDRHDWWVDRCGQEVRYVIDFYFHEEAAGTPEVCPTDMCLCHARRFREAWVSLHSQG